MPVSSEQTTYRRRLIICMYVQTSRIRMRAVHIQLLHSSHIQAFQASNIQASHIYSHTYRPATYTAIFRGKPHIQPYLQISRPLQPLLQASHIAGQACIYTAIFTDQPSVQPYLLASHIYSHIYRPAIFTGQAYIQPHIQAGHRPLHTQVLLASHTENRCTQAFQSTKSSCSCSIDCLSTGWLTRQQAHSLTDSPPAVGSRGRRN